MFHHLKWCSWKKGIRKGAYDVQKLRKETRMLHSTLIRLNSDAHCSNSIFSLRSHVYFGPTWKFDYGDHRICFLPQTNLGAFIWEGVILVKPCPTLTFCNSRIDLSLWRPRGPGFFTSAELISNIMERWPILSLPGKGCVTMSSPGLLPALSW